MADKTIYCGSGISQNKTWLKCTINPDKIGEYIQEYKGNKFVKLNINIYDEPNQFGKDVTITIDTYKKEEKPEEEEPTGVDMPLPEPSDDLPF